MLTRDAVVVLQEKDEGKWEDPGWIAAFDKKSGEENWRDEWEHTCCSYTTPLLIRRGSRAELVNATSGEIVAYDPATGDKLWKAEHGNIQTVPSLVFADDLLCIAGALHDRRLEVYRVPDVAGDKQPESLWTAKRATPNISSPVFYQGKLFTVAEGGVFTAYRPETGELLWQERLDGAKGRYRPSLVAGDGKIYAASDAGLTTVIEVGDGEIRQAAQNRLGEIAMASPAIAGGCLLIRGIKHLYCFGEG